MSIIEDLKKNINSILGVRDELGAGLKDVYLVRRQWTGLEAGLGSCVETKVKVEPSPRVVEFKHDKRIQSGGVIDSGDILLKMVSKQSYPTQDLIDGSSSSERIENLYDVGGVLYRVISVVEKHLTWNVQLRQLSDQTRF